MYHKSFNCTNEFDYLSSNSITQKSAYTAGKSCFLETVKKLCTQVQVDELTSEYDYFVEILTEKPSDEEGCDSPYYQFNGLKCTPILKDMSQGVSQIFNVTTKMNDSKVLNTIDLCDQAITCIQATCFSTDFEKMQITKSCEFVKMKNTEFTACENKMRTESPDLSKYSCLERANLKAKTKEAIIEAYYTEKDCTKQIMKDICGESAIENFDHYAQLIVNQVTMISS
ncbi:hypothetical protein CRE_09319 [Caenorhabditis remanei]|uniref:T20D4.11-like domain-containing protein n=1 Tax=Caenorhabditis remanei TaxID=31234 RepID=E3LI45_CAERE|nr:hypothetical protein CRE_09319 [Caenorhabditis remanei]